MEKTATSQDGLTLRLPDEAATRALARGLAALLKPGDLVAFHGDLGAGNAALDEAIRYAKYAGLSPDYYVRAGFVRDEDHWLLEGQEVHAHRVIGRMV